MANAISLPLTLAGAWHSITFVLFIETRIPIGEVGDTPNRHVVEFMNLEPYTVTIPPTGIDLGVIAVTLGGEYNENGNDGLNVNLSVVIEISVDGFPSAITHTID